MERREVVSLSWSEGEGHLRKAVVTEVGELVLSHEPWISLFPLPKHTSCLLSFYTAMESRGAHWK